MRMLSEPEQKIHIWMTHHTKMSKYMPCHIYLGQTLFTFMQRQEIHIFITKTKCTS
jgi:hypothetical protein